MTQLTLEETLAIDWSAWVKEFSPDTGINIVSNEVRYGQSIDFYLGDILLFEVSIYKRGGVRFSSDYSLSRYGTPRPTTIKKVTLSKMEQLCKRFIEGCLKAASYYNAEKEKRRNNAARQKQDMQRLQQLVPNDRGNSFAIRTDYSFGTIEFEPGRDSGMKVSLHLEMDQAEEFLKLLAPAAVTIQDERSTESPITN